MVRTWAVMIVVLAGLRTATAERHGAGFDLQPLASGTGNSQSRTIWVDGQDRVVFQADRPSGIGGGPLGRIGCFDTGGGSHYLDATANYTTMIATRRGQDTFVRVDLATATPEFVLDSCSNAPQSLGSYAFPVGHTPIQSMHPWLLDAVGSIYYTSSGGISKLAFSPALAATAVVTHAELQAAVGLSGAVPVFSIPALTSLPDGRLVFIAQLRIGSYRHDWLVERSLAGTLTIRWSQIAAPSSSWTPNVVYDAALDAVLFDRITVTIGVRDFVSLGVVPQLNSPSAALLSAAWPVLGHAISGGSAATFAYEVFDTTPRPVYRLVYDAAIADFDRDGLRATREATLGTSDYKADTDGDGVPDPAEVRQFATDPTSPSSSTPAATLRDDLILGSSLFAQYQALRGKSCPAPSRLSYGHVQCCNDIAHPQGTCTGPDDVPISNAYGAQLFPYSPLGMSPDHGFSYDTSTGVWSQHDFTTNASVALTNPLSYGISYAVPLSATSILMIDNNNLRMWRLTAGAATLAVLDAARVACPIVATAADLARCGDADLFGPPPTAIRPVGFDPESGLAMVAVRTDQGMSLIGFGDTAVVHLADLTAPSSGHDVQSVIPMREAGAKGFVITHTAALGAGGLGMKRLDAAFVEYPSDQPFLNENGAAAFFKRGFAQETAGISFLIEPLPPGCGCMAGSGVFVCDSCPIQTPRYIPKGPYPAEWIPVSPVLEKGEVILWSGTHYTGYAVGIYDTEWFLWRVTPVGAVVEWLDAASFTAALPVADRAPLAAVPLGPITAMGASPDGLKVCLAESAANRVWEITLDGSRRLSSIRLAATNAGRGCSYDDTGTLAVLGDPATIWIGGSSIEVAGISAPLGLLRLDGRWIVHGLGATARCIDATGTATDSTIHAVALSAAPGGVAYIDADGTSFVTTTARFCSGEPPLEVMISGTDANMWSRLNQFQTFRSTNAIRAAMALRPDGVAFLGITELIVAGTPSDTSQVVTKVLFHAFPQFAPFDDATRMRELDAFRLKEPIFGLASLRVLKPHSMITIPGAATDRDWGYSPRPGEPNLIQDPMTDGGTDPSPPAAGGGCGCGATRPPVAGLALLVMLALFTRGRRRR